MRDIDTDRRAGKRTLAVKLGRARARELYAAMLALAYVTPVATAVAGGLSWWILLPAASLPLAKPLLTTIDTRTDGPSLNEALAGTGRLLGVYLDPPVGGHPAVVRRSLLRLRIPLREPFVTAGGVVSARELVVDPARGRRGNVAFGEAAPLESYDGVSVDEVWEALRDGPPPRDAPPQARAAWELAELDLAARRRGKPLGEPGADAIPVNFTLPAGPPAEAAAAAKRGLADGFSCFKLKVGLPDDSPARLPYARRSARGRPCGSTPTAPGRADEAVAAIEALAVFDLELVEQPCATLEELAEVRTLVEIPIAADEPIRGPADVERAAELGACDAVNVKLSRLWRAGSRPRHAARRPRSRARRLAVEHARRAVGNRRLAPARRLRAAVAGLRPRHPRAVRRRDRACPAPHRRRASSPCHRAPGSASRCRTRR